METSKTTRTACDACYAKKIKCNGKRPRCSTCISHARKCSYGAPSREYKPRHRKAAPKAEDSNSDLQSRIQQLELAVNRMTEGSQRKQTQIGVETQCQVSDSIPTESATPIAIINESPGRSHHNRSFELPPQQSTMDLIHVFINNSNTILPLFHAGSLLRLAHQTYRQSPQHRDPVAWAAINVVLALTYRQGLMGAHSTHQSVEYANKAQSVLSEVVLGDIELLNIQVLVGMVMLIEGSDDLQAALILIASVLRLAHRIGLHNRASSLHLDPIQARQRACVFWIAYIIDKDLSLRAKQPSIQIDDDIDLELPGSHINDFAVDLSSDFDHDGGSTGRIATIDGAAHIHWFQARIQLAVIEGGVYDYLFSTRAQKRTREERVSALESVSRALDHWKASIPREFKALDILDRVPPAALRFLCVLHSTSLLCTTFINQAHLMNSQWVASLCQYGKDGTVPALPAQWTDLVSEARTMMVLFEQSAFVDRWSWWSTGCSYMTALVLLTANSMHEPQHEKSYLDARLVNTGLKTMKAIVEDTNNEKLRFFFNQCVEIQQHAQRTHGQTVMMDSTREFFTYRPW